ncbi:acyl-CoA thioesterase [Undibacterium sp. CY18W]|uniref:Acyl-CoA thioesterase n=1 Tax=Undibacterium hunanense TaxID=2762292 RepID=A0ABR6ZNF7_9BURK|nr:thioesterase family protein [Undibacterium hunanense]MBC3917422.1 acyl-CoA thioesterase [Undibacterium hunanense]
MIFEAELPIRFAHCDPAGIVFYPRYFEMMNGVVEDWCAQGLGCSFHEMHMVRGTGLPTVHLETDFIRPAQLGETLLAELTVLKLGNTSVEIQVCFCGQQHDVRLKARLVLVMMDLSLREAMVIPDELRAAMLHYCAAKDEKLASA